MTSLQGGITTMLRIFLLGRFRVERDGVPIPNVSVAASLFEESLSLFRAVGDVFGIGISLIRRGMVALVQRDWNRAAELHEESVTLYRELGNARGIATSLANLGEVALAQGHLERATSLYGESLSMMQKIGSEWYSICRRLGRMARDDAGAGRRLCVGGGGSCLTAPR